jgi:hypothetical protein
MAFWSYALFKLYSLAKFGSWGGSEVYSSVEVGSYNIKNDNGREFR